MADERIAKVMALLEECHSILEPMYPTRHGDEPLPNPPLLDIAQADIDVRDAIIKLRNYLEVYKIHGLFLEKLGEKYPGHPWLKRDDS